MLYAAIVFIPIVCSAIAGLGGRFIGTRASELVTTAGLFVSAALSLYTFYDVALLGNSHIVQLFQWIGSGDLVVNWTVRVDSLTAVMLVVVTGVSSLVHLYSIGYMEDDPHRPRFFSYLSLFTFAMLMLVTANNFLQLFFGWEGVGLASYLLIGFWYEKPEANAAAIKAFVVNRVGDFGFALGIFGVFAVFKTLDFAAVFSASHAEVGKTMLFAGHQVDVMTTLCLLLFVGAMGKSAQFLLHTWLPDAMEGPTPVSALIHAATMVTAGVFLVCRCSPMFEQAPVARDVVVIIGATTAFFAASVGLFQHDIKRVIAYSTCSQLGYMFVAAGVSAYGGAMFHLFTHAFFKALLFLSAGAVIVAMHHEQDMRKMGGLYKQIPFTWAMMLIGNLALTGVGIPLLGIGTAGFYSKDAIINSAFAAEGHMPVAAYGFAMTLIAAAMTSFYSWRQFLLTFHGRYRGQDQEEFDHSDEHSHDEPIDHDAHGHHAPKLEEIHEAPLTMLVPLGVLAVGALIAGMVFDPYFLGEKSAEFWHGTLAAIAGNGLKPIADEFPTWVELAPTLLTILGFGVAYYYYILHPELPAQMAKKRNIVYLFFYHKWYFDELYDFLFVRPALWIGRTLWKVGDGTIIDGLGPDGIATRVLDVTRGAVRMQSGYIFHYALAMLIGVFLIATWFTFNGGAL
ncbi:MAG TPA: NADH-quinone oxidoreductase subunit L [Rhizomicrobium sp.]|jgi:NADH-quinone oxidoreductase subunit L